jgi:hypothetical protein
LQTAKTAESIESDISAGGPGKYRKSVRSTARRRPKRTTKAELHEVLPEGLDFLGGAVTVPSTIQVAALHAPSVSVDDQQPEIT